jgi:cbb3-type cytochrome oxidase cytochrome c subunit
MELYAIIARTGKILNITCVFIFSIHDIVFTLALFIKSKGKGKVTPKQAYVALRGMGG